MASTSQDSELELNCSLAAGPHQPILNFPTLTALQTIRSDEGFSLFWKLVEQKQLKLDVDEPKLPRQRKVPRRYEVGSSIPDQSHQTSVQDLYKHTYFEVIDYVMQVITSRFDQKGYKTLAKLEDILCNEEANLNDYNDVFELYGSDFNREQLETQLVVLHSNLSSDIKSEHGGAKVKIIIGYLQNSSKCENEFYSEVIKLCKIILVMPATNALSERSFSILRRLKTWLRSTMQQTRLNWCMILHKHSDETDELDLRAIANEFVCRNSSRQRIFGHFDHMISYNHINNYLTLHHKTHVVILSFHHNSYVYFSLPI